MDKADPLLGSISVALSGHVLILTARVRGFASSPHSPHGFATGLPKLHSR